VVAAEPQPLIEASQPTKSVTQATVDVVSLPVESPDSVFITSMEEELKTIGTNIDLLTQKVNNIEANAKIQADHDLAALRQKFQYTSDQLNSLKGTTGAAWV
jgi:hypothetical protein